MTGSAASSRPTPTSQYRDPQNEYCEWHVTRNAAGKITKVIFVTESPEYWEHLWAVDRAAVVALYQTLRRAGRDRGRPAGRGSGSAYNKFNPFNTTSGIVHLIQSINTLSAALGLAQGSIHTGAARDNYETAPPGLRTSVDPRVIFDIGALARTGLSLTLARADRALHHRLRRHRLDQTGRLARRRLLAHRARLTRADPAPRVSGAAGRGIRRRRHPHRRPARSSGADRLPSTSRARSAASPERGHDESESRGDADADQARDLAQAEGAERKLGEILDELGKFEPKLPKDVLIPALGGDPAAELPGAEPEPVYGAKSARTSRATRSRGSTRITSTFCSSASDN